MCRFQQTSKGELMRKYRKNQLLTASEIARYVYCQRAWGYDREYWNPKSRQRLLFSIGVACLAIGILIGAIVTFGGA